MDDCQERHVPLYYGFAKPIHIIAVSSYSSMSLFIKICEVFLVVSTRHYNSYQCIHNKLLHYYILQNERIITHLIYGVKNIFTEHQMVKCPCDV